VIVITCLAAHVDHAVDGRAAAQHLAARVDQAAAVEARIGLGAEHPVGTRIVDAVEIADRNMDPDVVVLGTRFQQQHLLAGLAREPVGHDAAGSTGANDDVVVLPCRLHGVSAGLFL
jgi:nucleotide-binding universal stress UspA family protein